LAGLSNSGPSGPEERTEAYLHAIRDCPWFPPVQRVATEGRTAPGDLADLLTAAAAIASGCETVITFDKKAAKSQAFVLLS
jgi:predicted nucleic acid-binding protein